MRGKGRSLASIVVIAVTFEGVAVSRQRARHKQEKGDSSFWQRNELVFVGDVREAAGLPVLLGPLDPLLAGGYEIPPDVARALQRVAAEKHHPGWLCRIDRDEIAGPENQQ